MTNWKKVKLGDVCTDISYGYTESANSKPVGPKFLRITDIQFDHIDWSTVPYCKISDSDHKKYKLEKGDIVIARTGNSTGATSTIKNDIDAVYASYLIRYRTNKNIANPFFVDFALRSTKWNDFVNNIKGGSAQPGANAKQFAEFEFFLPDLPTQTRIASILSALDDKIELNRQMNHTLEQMARALFKKYFVDDIDPENLPEGWTMGRLGDISVNIKITIDPKDEETLNYVGLEHIPRMSIALYDWSEDEILHSQKFQFQENQILFGKLRPYFHKVVLAPIDGICSTDILVIEPIAKEYLSYSLMHFSSEEIIAYSNQHSGGTRMPRVSWESLRNFEIVIPPKNTMQQFEELISPVLNSIIQRIHENKVLKEIRDSLLPKLMNGELEIKEAETLVA